MKPLQNVLDEVTHGIIFYKIAVSYPSISKTNEVLRDVFCFVQELHEVHTGFLSQLQGVSNEHHATRLSDVFLKWCKKFLVYASYCANLTKASNLLQEKCEVDESFNQLIIVSIVIVEYLYTMMQFHKLYSVYIIHSTNVSN